MSADNTIRLNKVLRALNIPTAKAIQILENQGHKVRLNPSSKITSEQHKILLVHHNDFPRIEKEQKPIKLSTQKIETNTIPKVKKRKTRIKKVKKQNEKREAHIFNKKPEKSELIAKLEKICVGQSLKKIAVIFNIPNQIILKLGKSVIPDCSLEHRISNQNFKLLKPILESYVQEFIDDLPDRKVGESKGTKYRPTIYTKTSKYFNYVRIIYTNM